MLTGSTPYFVTMSCSVISHFTTFSTSVSIIGSRPIHGFVCIQEIKGCL